MEEEPYAIAESLFQKEAQSAIPETVQDLEAGTSSASYKLGTQDVPTSQISQPTKIGGVTSTADLVPAAKQGNTIINISNPQQSKNMSDYQRGVLNTIQKGAKYASIGYGVPAAIEKGSEALKNVAEAKHYLNSDPEFQVNIGSADSSYHNSAKLPDFKPDPQGFARGAVHPNTNLKMTTQTMRGGLNNHYKPVVTNPLVTAPSKNTRSSVLNNYNSAVNFPW